MAAGEADGAVVGVEDLGSGGKVDLGGAAEPDPVPGAELLVRWQMNGDRFGVSVPGGASSAGVGGADGSSAVVRAGTERWQRLQQRRGVEPAERGQALEVRCAGSGGAGQVVVSDASSGEPGW